MRIAPIVIVSAAAVLLGACSVVGVAADAANIGASVVTTTVSTAGSVAGTAARTVTGGSSSDEKKAR